MSRRVVVLYVKDEHFFGLMSGSDKVVPTHYHVVDAAEYDDSQGQLDNTLLEQVFCDYNGGDGSKKSGHLKVRSLSCGDVVLIGDEFYACLTLGWGQITDPQQQEQLRNLVAGSVSIS